MNPPKDDRLKILQGTFRKDRSAAARAKRADKSGLMPLGDPPEHLPALAAQYWRQAAAGVPAGHFCALDAGVLEIWCVARWLYRVASETVKREGSVLSDGKPHPAVAIAVQQAAIVLRAHRQLFANCQAAPAADSAPSGFEQFKD